MRHRETWPRTAGRRHQAACHLCDALHDAPLVEEGREARCRVCGEVLYENRPASLERAVAFGTASLVLMLVAHTFPFLELDAQGREAEMSLTGAALRLMQEGSDLLGLAVGVFTLLAPLILAGGLVYVCLPLMWGKAWPGAVQVTRLVQEAQPWAMLEVFILGVLVSLLKLVKLAEVELGIAFWALGLLMICLTAAFAGIDRRELWDRLEVAREQ
ncbi:MAG: paraquat-inducible protein A [Akkermansiaceae bacterium]|nr:paraquat-inducible protein A [Akkermansiaceae bacterium]NNM30110.1 paraquat-inducible protein A [Akkermansiaceae bacterium]